MKIQGTTKNMQRIKKIVQWTIIVFGFFILLGITLIEYSFEIDLFEQIVMIVLSSAAILMLIYFYFRPKFIIRKRREIFLLILTIILFFIFTEVILGITSCERDYEFFPEEELKYKHRISKINCNYIKDGKKFYAMSNNEGFIDEDFKFNEKDYNIFLLGDSFAQCLQTNYENCVHQKLQRDLREKYGEKVNIMNFGIGTYGGLAELSVLKTYQDIYKPKMIIVYVLAQNDFLDNEDYLGINDSEKNFRRTIRKLIPKTVSFFAVRGKNILNNILIKSEAYSLRSNYEPQATKNYEVYLEDYDKGWEKNIEIELNALEEMYNISLSENITMLLVAITSPEQVYEEDWKRILKTYPSLKGKTYILSKPNDIIMTFAEEMGINHLDLLPLFKENPKRLHWTYDGHWNDEGQLFAAEKIKEYIINNNLIKNVK